MNNNADNTHAQETTRAVVWLGCIFVGLLLTLTYCAHKQRLAAREERLRRNIVVVKGLVLQTLGDNTVIVKFTDPDSGHELVETLPLLDDGDKVDERIRIAAPVLVSWSRRLPERRAVSYIAALPLSSSASRRW